MPLAKLLLRPGINKQITATQNEGGWSDASLVRWRDGQPEKFGGWASQTSTVMTGIPRGISTWADTSGNLDAAIGTNNHLYLYQGGATYDITPARKTTSPLGANPLATTNGSATVTVTDAAHGAAVGDLIVVSGATAVAGLTISGEYTIVTVPNANTYTITASGNANATTSGGGAAVVVIYLISPGAADAAAGLGWGADTWDTGTWGTARTTSSFLLQPRTWSTTNWGSYLIASPKDGSVYQWQNNLNNRATLVTQAPLSSKVVLVGMPERHLVCLGTSDVAASTNYDPMLIRWSDVEDYTVWTATATNSAGSFRISGGSRIVGALNVTNQILVWTDAVVWSMRFTGAPYIYRFDRVGSGCGLISPNGAVDYNGSTYWMSTNAFFVYRGSAPAEIPCTEWRAVFNNLNRTQQEKVACGLNSQHGEIVWFYPSLNATENDSYIIFNTVQNIWYSGTLARTGWADRGTFTSPLAVDPTGHIHAHETGNDADGAAMSTYLESGYIDIADGTEYVYVDRLIPDIQAFSGTLQFYIKTLDSPMGTPVTKGPYTLTTSTPYAVFRARGRQAAIRFESSSIGDAWRLGAIRVNSTPDGRR